MATPPAIWMACSSRSPRKSSTSKEGLPAAPAASAARPASGAAPRASVSTPVMASPPSGPSVIRAAPSCSITSNSTPAPVLRLACAPGEIPDQRIRRQLPGQGAQREQRGLVRPLEIVQADQHRAAFRTLLEQHPELLYQPHPHGRRVGVGVPGGKRVQRFAERGQQGSERHRPAQLVRRGYHEREPAPGRFGHGLAEKRGLTHAGLALDGNTPPGPFRAPRTKPRVMSRSRSRPCMAGPPALTIRTSQAPAPP